MNVELLQTTILRVDAIRRCGELIYCVCALVFGIPDISRSERYVCSNYVILRANLS